MLVKQLYSREFVWLIANDDNRCADGKDLRELFVTELGFDKVDPNWMDLGCSMLEMLIALAKRAAYESDKSEGDWFWIFMQNMGIRKFNDAYYKNAEKAALLEIDDAIQRVVWRTYSPDGEGGLFPLRHPSEDQRRVELWYQLSAYLLENSLV